jgi:anti-anti-sigma factor
VILVDRKDNVATIRPAGEVVAASAQELRSCLQDVVKEGARELVVDLSNVRMVDSIGIGLLISTHNSLTKLGGRLAVTHASRDLMDLFRVMRIHQHFSVAGDSAAEGI